MASRTGENHGSTGKNPMTPAALSPRARLHSWWCRATCWAELDRSRPAIASAWPPSARAGRAWLSQWNCWRGRTSRWSPFATAIRAAGLRRVRRQRAAHLRPAAARDRDIEKWGEDLASPGFAQLTNVFRTSLGMGGREPARRLVDAYYGAREQVGTTQRLQGLSRLPRPSRKSQRPRRRLHRHAGPLARAHLNGGHAQAQTRALPEADDAFHRRGAPRRGRGTGARRWRPRCRSTIPPPTPRA